MMSVFVPPEITESALFPGLPERFRVRCARMVRGADRLGQTLSSRRP